MTCKLHVRAADTGNEGQKYYHNTEKKLHKMWTTGLDNLCQEKDYVKKSLPNITVTKSFIKFTTVMIKKNNIMQPLKTNGLNSSQQFIILR